MQHRKLIHWLCGGWGGSGGESAFRVTLALKLASRTKKKKKIYWKDCAMTLCPAS